MTEELDADPLGSKALPLDEPGPDGVGVALPLYMRPLGFKDTRLKSPTIVKHKRSRSAGLAMLWMTLQTSQTYVLKYFPFTSGARFFVRSVNAV